MFAIGQTFIARSGDTRYTIVDHSKYSAGRVILRVDVKYNDGSWHTTNDRSPDRTARIAALLESGHWIQEPACTSNIDTWSPRI